MAAWPSSLPQRVLAAGYGESVDPVLLRSTVDVGPAKLRPAYTAEVKKFQAALNLSAAQVDTLETFWTSALVFGSAPFDWLHPRTGAAASLRFRARPTYSALGGGYQRAALMLELLP
jgi:hypothetical protein